MIKQQRTKREQILFNVLPEDDLVQCVEEAFFNLCHTRSGPYSIQQMEMEKQSICGIFHTLIVTEIVHRIPGWRPGKQGVEPDLVHQSGVTVQVKTKSSPEGIAGNRYSSKNEYADPSEFYLCVNFLPNDCICKIRAGWVESSWWKPQTGNGNASVLNREKLDLLPFLKGSYLHHLNLIAINGIGEKTLAQLNKQHIFRLSDLFEQEKFVLARPFFCQESFEQITHLLTYLNEAFPQKKDHMFSFDDDLIHSITGIIQHVEAVNGNVFDFFRELSTIDNGSFQHIMQQVLKQT